MAGVPKGPMILCDTLSRTARHWGPLLAVVAGVGGCRGGETAATPSFSPSSSSSASPAEAAAPQAEVPSPQTSEVEAPTTSAADPAVVAPSSGTDPWPAFPASAAARIEQMPVEQGQAPRYRARVTAPWGAVDIDGPNEGAAGAVSRYWAAFCTADFSAVYAFAAGEMRERLGTYDSPGGHKDFAASIESRMTTNPVVAVRVDTVREVGGDKAEGLVITRRADGTEEQREVYLVKDRGQWRLERVRQQR